MTTRPAAGDPALGILALNGGASSLKFALFATKPSVARIFDGQIDRIGISGTTLALRRVGGSVATHAVEAANPRAAVADLLARIAAEHTPGAVGHRIVHGGDRYQAPCRLTPLIRADLQRLAELDPDHLPFALDLIDGVDRHWPGVAQVACFDTAFHRDLPRVAQLLPLPRRLFDAGVRRYGFHGLSCTSLLDELERTEGRAAAAGRLVLAHLGSGASLTAVEGRRSVDTTMAFTPASGVPMGTRSGDLDPGIVGYLARVEGMSAERFVHMVNRESGLLGVSGVSSDVRDLLARSQDDARAADAVELFCYEITKRVGAMAAAMGGIDRLVFTGGIGENAASIRARICARLGFLGIRLDPERNEAGVGVVSREDAPVAVHVMRADEERVIAEAVVDILETHPRTKAGGA